MRQQVQRENHLKTLILRNNSFLLNHELTTLEKEWTKKPIKHENNYNSTFSFKKLMPQQTPNFNHFFLYLEISCPISPSKEFQLSTKQKSNFALLLLAIEYIFNK